jgi:hypothetical protein
VAHQSPDYSVRTRLNVRDSDATLIFRSTRAATHKGCDLTKRACGEFGKPALVIPAWAPVVPSPVKVAEMIRAAGFQVVNVAGSRASADPAVAGVVGSGIEEWTFTFCLCVFEILMESK